MLSDEQSQSLLLEYVSHIVLDHSTKDLPSYEMGVLITLGQYLTGERTTYIQKSEIESIVMSRGLIKPSVLLNTLVSKNLIEVNRVTQQVTIPMYSKLYFDMLDKTKLLEKKKQRKVNVKNVPKDGILLISGEDPSIDSPVVFSFPLRDGSFALVTKAFIDEQQRYFSNVQVSEQLSRAVAWCNSNQNKLKEPSGIRKFINSWLSKAAGNADTLNAVIQYQNKNNGFGRGSVESIANQEQSDDFGIATISLNPQISQKRMSMK